MEILLRQAIATTIVFPLYSTGTKVKLSAATMAAGDFKICRHTAAAWNVANPTTAVPVEIGTTGLYTLPLTTTELTPDDQQYPIIIACHDALGAQWDDQDVYIRISTEDLDSLPASVWASTTRTLTQPGATVVAAVAGTSMNVVKYATFSGTLTGLTIPATWTKVYLTVKSITDSLDTASQLQIVESNPGVATDGLKYIIGTTTALALLTVTDAQMVVTQAAGTIAITITDEATAKLTRGNYAYDVKCLLADGSSQLLSGSALLTISDAETRAIV